MLNDQSLLTFCSGLLQTTRTRVTCYHNVRFSLNVLLVGEEIGRLQMFAYGLVHNGTVEFTQLGINDVSFTLLLLCSFHADSAILQ